MITQDTISSKAELSAGVTTSNFTIKSSPAAFRILASGLYANKIRSIIRELSCNARDSHVAVGNTEPWEIHMPTTYEPYFYVKDHGLGLSHDEVITIYTTFFESTKTDSDDYVGCLGLGSKSPFSYTDNFTITAIKDGKLNIYSAFIDEAGLPAVAHLGSDTTDQPNGVEVRFAVNTKDFNTFSNEVQHALCWFDQMPTGNIVIHPARTNTIELIDDVTVETSGYTGSVAIMGGVCYPIEVQHPKLAQYAYLANQKLVLRFDIGELEVQPSREGLSYTNSTVDAISDRFVVLTRSINKYCTVQLEAAANIFDKIKVVNQLTKNHITATVARSVYSNWLDDSKLADRFPNIGYDRVSIDHNRYDLSLVRMYAVSGYRGNTVKKIDTVNDLIVSLCDLAMQRVTVVYNDGGVSQKDLLEYFKGECPYVTVFVFNKPSKSHIDVDQLSSDLCGYQIQRTSEFDIERAERTKSVKHAGIYTLAPTSIRDGSMKWQPTDRSVISGCVYVDLTNRQIDVKYRNYEGQLDRAFGGKLIGISTASKVDRSQATRLDAYLKNWVEENINEHSIKQHTARNAKNVHGCAVPFYWNTMRNHLRPHADLIDDPVLKVMCESVDAADGLIWDNLSHLITPLISTNIKAHHSQMITDINACFKRYKLVDFDLSYGASTETKLKFIKILNFIYNLSNEENENE